MRGTAAVLGIVLVLVGLGAWGSARVAAGFEDHAYTPGGVPPASVRVTKGETYRISYAGGVGALFVKGIDVSSLACQWRRGASTPQSLTVRPLDLGTTYRNAVAEFDAPVTGSLAIDCDGLGAAFVDDSDGVSVDWSGVLLVLATLALATGAAFGVSALRGPGDQLSGRVAP